MTSRLAGSVKNVMHAGCMRGDAQVDERVLDEDILQNMIRLYQSPNQNRISQIWDAIRCAPLTTDGSCVMQLCSHTHNSC